MPQKLDLYKENKAEYAAKLAPAVVKIGPAVYLSISGRGAPGGNAFSEAIGALYGVAFTIKMAHKFGGKQDYAVCKLEGVWPNLDFDEVNPDRESWTWRLMIRTPKFITKKDLSQAVETLIKRGKGPDVKRVELQPLTEGQCVQALHVGPYKEEGPKIKAMRDFAEKQGLRVVGAHHEIYLSDPRRVAPAKLRTILRQPVKPARFKKAE